LSFATRLSCDLQHTALQSLLLIHKTHIFPLFLIYYLFFGDLIVLKSDRYVLSIQRLIQQLYVHTAVELIFELKGRTYRILRQLGHQKKGNKSKTGEKYEFYELIGDSEVQCVEDRKRVE